MKRILSVAAVAVLLAACGGGDSPKGGPGGGAGGGPGGRGRGPMAFPVEVQDVSIRPVEFVVRGVGSVEAFETVQVTARVGGAIEKVRFTEGQQVEKDHVLVEIEPRRYQLAVQAAEASLRKAQAARADAQAALERRAQVNEQNPGLIRGEELETFRTRAQTAAAEVAQAQVALEQAQLNLRDAYVRAPVAGTLQTRTVQTGQYVQPGVVLATLVRRDPLLVRFQVTEADAARIDPGSPIRFKVKSGEYDAKISHVAAQASSASRMVIVTAEVAQDAKAAELRPGAFAEVTVPIGAVDAPVIPQTAVRPSERGFLAYVVEGGQAKERVLQLGMRTPDGRVEVRAGLKEGDRLVVRGGEALRDGAPVTVSGDKPQGAAPAGGAPRPVGEKGATPAGREG